jgi:hypothetical protein
MKVAAVVASLVIHVAGLLAIPTDARDEAAAHAATVDQSAVAVNAPSCKCDLEIGAIDCPRSDSAR